MKRLKKARLYGSELVPVSGILVSRYNQALAMIGFAPTALENFSIDGMGWSPEIAEEKKDIFYLSHGPANPFAIIVSPEQMGKPVYFPHHSFDRKLMAEIFRVNEEQIKALTQQNSICIDIDQAIDAYYNPIDLLEYKDVHTAFQVTGGLEQAKKEQEGLVKKFFKGDNYLDVDVHNQLLSSVRRHGDITDIDISLKPIKFSVSNFYTKAFDGVFVIRTSRKQTIMIAETKETAEALKKHKHVHSFHVYDEGLLKLLIDLNFLEFNPYKVSQNRVKRLSDSTFVRAVSSAKMEHDIIEILESRPLYKRYVNSIGKENAEEHIGFSQIVREIETKSFNPNIKKEYARALCQPHSKLKGGVKDLMWQLLGKVSQWDAFNLYKYDKEEFYKAYTDWKEPQKEWAVECILKHNK